MNIASEIFSEYVAPICDAATMAILRPIIDGQPIIPLRLETDTYKTLKDGITRTDGTAIPDLQFDLPVKFQRGEEEHTDKGDDKSMETDNDNETNSQDGNTEKDFNPNSETSGGE